MKRVKFMCNKALWQAGERGEREEVEAGERGRGRWQRALIDSQWLWGWRHFNSELWNRCSGAAERQRESVKESERERKRGRERVRGSEQQPVLWPPVAYFKPIKRI